MDFDETPLVNRKTFNKDGTKESKKRPIVESNPSKSLAEKPNDSMEKLTSSQNAKTTSNLSDQDRFVEVIDEAPAIARAFVGAASILTQDLPQAKKTPSNQKRKDVRAKERIVNAIQGGKPFFEEA